MANVRDSDTSLWLHNKLGTSNDSWISGSICSQLNKEVLRNIKECFPDLQTQVKLKLLLSLFHIPRRLVEEWKRELEEVIEVAGLDSELWVSMLAETMKTFPATSSLNTEITDYEETRPIFTDMVNDLRKMVNKHSSLGMLPLECQYLNKNALVSVVGQQANPVKHFTLKRKPKSATLRTELLHKSADAQSSLKKTSAPTIPLRSRGMPRKMTDTTPMKGIPSRMPTSGFRSPNVTTNTARPNLSRTPAGRKDGGIKLIEFTDQPLGYAAAKKRKREQQLEEQQKKQEQKQAAAAAAAASPSSPPPKDLNATAVSMPDTPTTPTTANVSFEIKTETPTANLSQTSVDEDEEMRDATMETTTPKIEPSTPEYATTLTTYTATQPTATVVTASEQLPTTPTTTKRAATKAAKAASAAANAAASAAAGNTEALAMPALSKIQTPTIASAANSAVQTPTRQIQATKRIKQEIEIKSEEILVPASIKVEKLDNQSTPTQVQQQPARPQRIIIQQQHQQQQPQQQQQQTQHVLIRTTQPQQKQMIGNVTLTRQNSSTAASAASTIKMEKLDIKPLVVRSTTATGTTNTNITQQQQVRQTSNPLANLPNNISVKITSTKAKQAQQQQQQQPILINSSTPVILASSPSQTVRQKQTTTTTNTVSNTAAQTIKSLSQLKNAANSGPVIISQTIIQHANKRNANTQAATSGASNIITQQQHHQTQQQQQPQQQQQTQYIITSPTTQQHQQVQHQQQQQQHHQQIQQQQLPTLTTFTQARQVQQHQPQQQQQTTTLYQTASGAQQTPTKILLKTSPTSGTVMMTPMRQTQQQTNSVTVQGNPPPLIATSATQQPTMLSIQNVQLPNRPVTIQPASHAAQQQHLQAQLQHHPQPQHTIVSNTTATQQPKLTQVVMQSSNPMASAPGKNKIILTQKGMLLRSLGNDMYEQIPISNVSGLQTLGAGTTLMTTAAGPPSLVKTTPSTTVVQPTQTIHIQQQQQQPTTTLQQHQLQASTGKQLPTLITNTLAPQTTHMIVQQQPTQTSIINPQQTIIRPVMQSSLASLPQGLTLIQRPGQQPQLVQVQASPAPTQPQIQRTIITQAAPQQQQQQLRTQQIVLQHKPATQSRIITTTNAAGQSQQIQIQQQPNANIQRTTQIVQVQQPQQQQQQQPQRKGLSLSNEHVHKAHEMFRKANRVSRPDKALILGFMAGMRENPRPNSENAIVIKLGETEEKVQQDDGTTALCLAESLIRLDYNTGEWKTFQNYRRLDQSGGGGGSSSGVIQTQSSVVI